jgi:uncharacterized protein YjbJ (UPF0337 family)
MNGMTDKAIGKAKQVAGIGNNDEQLEGEGKGQEAKGNLKQKASDALDKVGNTADDLKKKLNSK